MLAQLGLMLCLACWLVEPASSNDVPIDVGLVLAVDVSSSMDEDEFKLQRAGYAEALRSPEFIDAVKSGANGRIALAYFEWAGGVRDDAVLSWQVIDSAESAAAFASKIEARPYRRFIGTSISGALDFGTAMLDRSGFSAERRVIDISGDGPNNSGDVVTAARDETVAKGIIVNGLPIQIHSSTFPRLDDYYAQCVTGGPGSFVLPISNVGEFSTAIRRKLVLEVSGGPGPRLLPASQKAPIDCRRGERDMRLYSAP
jgi:hypothetical protein